MKSEQLYQLLRELAEKLDITVSEQNFRITGIYVQSGFCKVKEKKMFVMDKNKSIHSKINLLAEYLSKLPYDDIYIIPKLRELLQLHKGTKH